MFHEFRGSVYKSKKYIRSGCITPMLAVALLALMTVSPAQAHSHGDAACDLKVQLTKAAEMQEGGAHFKGKPGTAMAGMKMDGMKMEGKKSSGMKMGDSKGAHEVHTGTYGGTFFMAPNKTHHIEGKYSEKCGFSLVLFNAYTKPISANRFKAFVKYIPEDDDQIEAYRILSPSEDGSVLRAPKGPHIKGAFDIELYVEFPGKPAPDMFNIPGRKMAMKEKDHK